MATEGEFCRTAGDDGVQNPSAEQLRSFLRSARSIAVVGLSSNPARPSYYVSAYMQSAGYKIFPVNPEEREVLGEKVYARLEDLPQKVDVVNIFRRPEFLAEVVDSAIRIGARMVWMQDDLRDDAAAARARNAGLLVVQDDCLYRVHHHLMR